MRRPARTSENSMNRSFHTREAYWHRPGPIRFGAHAPRWPGPCIILGDHDVRKGCAATSRLDKGQGLFGVGGDSRRGRAEQDPRRSRRRVYIPPRRPPDLEEASIQLRSGQRGCARRLRAREGEESRRTSRRGPSLTPCCSNRRPSWALA